MNGGRLPRANTLNGKSAAFFVYMIEIRNLSQRFAGPRGWIEALHNVNLTIPPGEVFGIIGRSGAGKSTLVRTINLLTRPSEGSVIVDGRDLTTLPAAQLRTARRDIGMIFQHFNLLSSRTVFDNVALPLELAGMKRGEIESTVLPLLDLVGLTTQKDRYPAQISGGQKQRVGIARRWPASRKCFSPTKPHQHLILKPHARSLISCARSTRISA